MLKNTLIVVAAMAALSSQATLIVNEPFLIGTNRPNNEYGTGDIRGFGLGSGTSGLVGAAPNPWSGSTSNYFIPNSAGVALPGLTDADVSYEQGSMVRWGGSADTSGFNRQVSRGILSYTGASTYYFSIMMRRENWATANQEDSLAGFTNAATGSGLKGFLVGYEAERGAGQFPSLVIKAGNINVDPTPAAPASAIANIDVSGADSTFARTYTFVVKMEVNLSGPETFTYWVDDDVTTTNWGNEVLASATAKYKGTFTAEAMTSLTDITRVAMIGPQSSGAANYDEFRMATSLESVTGVANVLIPEPSSMGLLALAIPALRRRRA